MALEWLARDVLHRHRLEVTVEVKRMPARMNEGARVLLYSAARELLMNVVKHAGTRKASLILRRVPGRVELEVTDRGRGMSATPATARPDHHPFGLFSIRERAELLGGTLTVCAAPVRGTRVVLALPLAGKPPSSRR